MEYDFNKIMDNLRPLKYLGSIITKKEKVVDNINYLLKRKKQRRSYGFKERIKNKFLRRVV